MYVNRLSQVESVAAKVDSQHKKEVKENRAYLRVIFDVVKFLSRQGLPLRGHDESDGSKNRGNLLELVSFLSKYCDDLKSNMNKSFNYLSPTIQNEMIEIISKEIIKEIIPKEMKYFSIMVDKTMDSSKHEQVAICLRYLDDNLNINE